jgi:hypothetical protein
MSSPITEICITKIWMSSPTTGIGDVITCIRAWTGSVHVYNQLPRACISENGVLGYSMGK